jgi:hypothetical protein
MAHRGGSMNATYVNQMTVDGVLGQERREDSDVGR